VSRGAFTREGYKKTELGWIPEDWEVKRLGELCEKIGSGSTPRGGNEVYKDKGISLIRSQNVLDFDFSYDGLAFIDDIQASLLKNVTVLSNDILINITGDSVARVCMVPESVLPARVNQHVSILRTTEKFLLSKFLKYYLLNPVFKNHLLILANSGGTRNALTKDILENLKILLPPLPEQKKIAEILSTWDEAIEKLNSYIEAKKKLKKALMQRLLTGKQRIKEFIVREGYKKTELGWIPEDWEVKRLGELGSFLKGKGIKKDEISNQGLPCIRYGEIYTQHHEYIKNISSFISKEIAESSQKIDIGTILFAASGETKEEIGKCVANTQFEDIYAGGDIIIFSPCLLTNDPMFLGFLLNVSFIQSQKSKVAQGDSIVHIYSSSLEKIKIPLPLLPEQKKIAEILSKADEEIDLLNQELEKLKIQKKGLMQKLLTGAWRVKL
jgi:type I restriction enzyme S subunit